MRYLTKRQLASVYFWDAYYGILEFICSKIGHKPTIEHDGIGRPFKVCKRCTNLIFPDTP